MKSLKRRQYPVSSQFMMISRSTSTYSGVNASPDEANAKEAINHLAAAIVNGAKLIASSSSSLLICVIQEPEDQESSGIVTGREEREKERRKSARNHRPSAFHLFLSEDWPQSDQVNQINIPLLVLQSPSSSCSASFCRVFLFFLFHYLLFQQQLQGCPSFSVSIVGFQPGHSFPRLGCTPALPTWRKKRKSRGRITPLLSSSQCVLLPGKRCQANHAYALRSLYSNQDRSDIAAVGC